ncbi:PREDICTED: zinc finger protein 2-like [Papilio polytes]|uniref:zinc finger protein 2-like n=1 Tax=Papilio polytes TaxID=76194 RepID=UPI00067678D0|nr:PREDICTED: zinc finger protein 2-like [Papilio polytes]XP_013135233.1 PREDICTED: zinc finger protein 2-like [Papilio polytes]
MTYTLCQICLKGRDKVLPLSGKNIEIYNRILKEPLNESGMLMCIFCTSLLRKLDKFVEQCRIAQMKMDQVVKKDTLNVINNIGISPTRIDYIGPEMHLDGEIKPEVNDFVYTTDEDDVPLVLFCESSMEATEYDNGIVNTNIIDDEKSNTKLDTSNPRKNCRKVTQKKVLKEGFSSRMVQETSEYTVIKLTKEQVLEEMKERSKSDKYLRAPYKCESCVKGFNFEDVLQSHMEKHLQKQGEYKCELCSQYCGSAVSLRGHMKSHTTRYRCKICGYIRLSRQHVLEHHTIVHTHAAAAYSCGRCVFTTDKRTVMQRHVHVHDSTATHECHKCGKLYKSLESLRVHTMRHDNKKRFQCDQCNLSFVYPTQLHKHTQSVHIRRDYYCVECDIKFKSMDTLKLHFKRAKRHRDVTHNNKNETRCISRTRSRRKQHNN